jgi:hypothetical protein
MRRTSLFFAAALAALALPSVAHAGYGASAAGIDEGFNNVVGVGVAWNYPTLAAAEAWAITNCTQQGVSSCRIVGTWSGRACGFITSGQGDDGMVAWGSGASQEEAYAQCMARVAYCRAPVGGCNNN